MMNSEYSQTLDLSAPAYRVSIDQSPAEALLALPRTKAHPAQISTDTSGANTLEVSIANTGALSASVPVYGGANLPRQVTLTQLAPRTLELFRVGLLIPSYLVDTQASVPGSSGDPRFVRMSTAIAELNYWLNIFFSESPTSSAGGFEGILPIVKNVLSRSSSTPDTIPEAVSTICAKIQPRGRTGGEGVDCLVGNSTMLQSLVNYSAGIGGSGEYRRDRRLGRSVFHFMGIPFYRAEFPDSGVDQGYLLGMNLGANGVHLVHAYGTADSMGVQADPLPINPSTATQDVIVHGAWGLAVWDPMAVFLCDAVAY